MKLKSTDIRELEALHPGESMGCIIAKSIGNSTSVFVAENNKGEIWGIFGLGKEESGVMLPWMLSTDEINANPTLTLKHAHSWLKEVQKTSYILCNIVSVENSNSIRFLEHIGFKFLTNDVHNINGVDFIMFYWSKEPMNIV
jgi:hypothetical protein